jgi:hypothetical protein
MHPRLRALTLGSALALATVTEAGPRRAPVAPVLTPTEQICEAYGTFAFNRGMDRNHGYGMIEVLRLSRQWDAAHASGARARAMHDAIIRGVYAPAGQQLSPIALRQLTESACLDGAQPLQAGTTSPDRY